MILTGGIGLLSVPGLGQVFGTGMALTGIDVLCRSVRQEGLVGSVRSAWNTRHDKPGRMKVTPAAVRRKRRSA
ncbi:MAG: hypothetical protein ABJC19_07455 [Gemmatimonadota bacterium]